MIKEDFKAKGGKEIDGKVGLLIWKLSNFRSSHKLFYQRSRFLPYLMVLKAICFSEKKEKNIDIL